MNNSDFLVCETILELENGKNFSEIESLVRLLSIGSLQAKEGKTKTVDELLQSLKEKFE